MALTLAKVEMSAPLIRSGGVVIGAFDITFDSSGPAWTVTAAQLNLAGILAVIPAGPKDGYPLEVDHANAPTSVTINAFEEADGGAAMGAADAADLDAAKHRFLVVGY